MTGHARLSPSGAKRWRHCTASPHAEAGRPSPDSGPSRAGTVQHLMAAEILESCGLLTASDYLGRQCVFTTPGNERWAETIETVLGPTLDVPEDAVLVEVTADMVEAVQKYVDRVEHQVATTGGTLHVEVKVPIDHLTGEEGATGTSDAVIVCEDEILVVDAKFGRQRVDAMVFRGENADGTPAYDPNDQLAMYASGAIKKLWPWMMTGVARIRLVIIQPHIGHESEFTLSGDDLYDWCLGLKEDVLEIEHDPQYRPSADTCHFCRASGDCQAQRDLLSDGFLDLAGEVKPVPQDPLTLGRLLDLAPLLELTVKAAQANAYALAQAGTPPVGKDGAYKLVAGKMGSRRWTSPEDAEAAVKEARLTREQAYEMELKSPAQLEKAIKEQKPRIWARLEKLIVQQQGKPVLVPATSPKKALEPLAATDGLTDCSDMT